MSMDRTTRKATTPTKTGLVIPDQDEFKDLFIISMKVRSVVGEAKKTQYMPQHTDIRCKWTCK